MKKHKTLLLAVLAAALLPTAGMSVERAVPAVLSVKQVKAGMKRLADGQIEPFTDEFRIRPGIKTPRQPASIQTPEGYWARSLLEADAYPIPETSGAGFYCFGLARGINSGVPDRADAVHHRRRHAGICLPDRCRAG